MYFVFSIVLSFSLGLLNGRLYYFHNPFHQGVLLKQLAASALIWWPLTGCQATFLRHQTFSKRKYSGRMPTSYPNVPTEYFPHWLVEYQFHSLINKTKLVSRWIGRRTQEMIWISLNIISFKKFRFPTSGDEKSTINETFNLPCQIN